MAERSAAIAHAGQRSAEGVAERSSRGATEHDIVPFHVARSTHTNLLVMWLLSGFMGSAYFIVPEEARRDIYWPRLAYVQLAGLVAVGVTAIIGFNFGWWEGRKFLEIPRPLDYLVVIDVLLFIANIGMTLLKGPRKTTTSIVLYFGLMALSMLAAVA